MYLAFKKFKNDCKILKITGTEFCPLKPEIAPSSIGFRLNTKNVSKIQGCKNVSLESPTSIMPHPH